MTQPEVGPNDIVIHLVNPYRCGDCGSEFCMRSLFLEHLAEHIDLLKAATPCHQIVCATSLIEQQPGGITVTRDILQINEQQMFELQDVSMDYSQLTPLKALEQAGILNLPHPVPVSVPAAPTKENPIVLDMRDARSDGRKISLLKNQQLQQISSGLHVQIMNANQNKLTAEANQANVHHLDSNDPRASELDSIVQQALFGDNKRECRIAISNPVQLTDGQSLTEVIGSDSQTSDFDYVDNKSILGRGRVVNSMKEKGQNNNVVCLICSNVFANASVLERHQVVHTGAKPYSCNICFKVFNDISSHRKHSLIHKRQHRCPVCHRMYLRRPQLLLHMKQHKKKRFIQFGNNFHEVQVNVTRNSDGQLVQEYSLPFLSTLETSVKSIDVSTDDQILIKEEYTDASTGMKTSLIKAPENVDISYVIKQESDKTNASNVQQSNENLSSEPPKKIIYRCGHCKLFIYTRPTLSRHLIKHTNTRPFQCEICLKSFHDKADLLHHHKTHTKPVQCKTCFSSFSKVLYLQNHLLKGCPVTDNDSRFTLLPDLQCQCNICPKILKNKANVLRHLRVHAFQDRLKSSGHEGEVAASTENVQSSELENLSQNLEDHFHPLPNSVGYRCLICGQEFRFKSFIITHIRIHLNHRPYKCTDCPKSFYAKQMLKKHQQNHTRPYKCPECNKSFIRRYLMKAHFKKRHEQEDPLKDVTELLDEKLIQCDICGKTMKSFQKSVMLSHIRLHKDVRPFECKVCHKSFISDNALRKHSLNHTKPYKCHICSKGFSRRYLLTDHFKKKCGRKKRGNFELNGAHMPEEIIEESQTNKVDSEDLLPSTVDASIECQPYEAKIITEQDLATSSTIYTCQPCDKRFTIYDALVRHINTFSKPTPCKYCQVVYEDKHLTLSHQRSCLGPSLSPLQKCSKKNKTLGEQQEKVQKMMQNINKKIETLTSETSLSEIPNDNLTAESSYANSNQISRQNSSDQSQTENESSLITPVTRTLKILKEAKGRLSCPECGRGFDTPRGLKIHASSHVRLFKCEVCDKDFTQISNLRAHVMVHKTGKDVCLKSELGVSSKLSKINRQLKACNVPDDKDESVIVENKQRQQMSGKMILPGKRRRRKVSGDNIDSDDDHVADMKVEHKNLLEVTHRLMQSGTRGRPYSCKMCRRRFTEECGLKAHMMENHGVRT